MIHQTDAVTDTQALFLFTNIIH